MKIHTKKNVVDAAKERIRFLFDEFENVVVGVSGGKDSTVVLNLALEIAKEKNRLPLRALFIDQEAEWEGTIETIKKIMYNPDIKPMWFQMPMVITNNASSFKRFAYCWNDDEKDKWIHQKDPISIKENIYGTERFHDLFEAIFKVEFEGKKACYIAGVRTEENPKRFVALTSDPTYKWITWGKKLYRQWDHYTFYPIYDWSFRDVWKYINEKGCHYNPIYDEMYRYGVPLLEMRISNLHHETAIHHLLTVQEIEPQTWNKLVERIDGASAIKHIKRNSFVCPKELPFMFKDWQEYAIHLMDNIIQDEVNRKALKTKVEKKWEIYNGERIQDKFWRIVINTILSSDWDFTKIVNWEMSPQVMVYRWFKQGKNYKEIHNALGTRNESNLKYLTEDDLKKIKETLNG